jgi:hypothetical protein
MTALLTAAAGPEGGAAGGGAATEGAAGVGGAANEGPEWAAPIILVKSLCTGCAGITGVAGGRLMFAPGIGVAEADGDGGSGTTGGGPDQGLDGDSGGGGGGAAGRGGGATTRSIAEVALGLAPLLPLINGAAGGGTGSGSAWVTPKIRVNSPGAGAFGAAGGGAAGLGGGGGGATGGVGGLGPLPGSRNRTEIEGTALGSDFASGLASGFGGLGGSAAFGIEGGVHDTVGESIAATGAPRAGGGDEARKISVNPPAAGAGGGDAWVVGATRSSHLPNESKSRIMRVTTTGTPSTFSTPSTRSRASAGKRSRRARIPERSDALS